MFLSKGKVFFWVLLAVGGLTAGVAGLAPRRPQEQTAAEASSAGVVRNNENRSRPPAEQGRLDRYGDPLPDGAVARIGTLRFRNGQARQSIFSPDIAFGPEGKTVFSIHSQRS